MQKLIVFNNVSLDGYFVDGHGEMSWAHGARESAEWREFTDQNATGGGVFLFGRVTYDLMKSFWPTEQAARTYPVVAERMNNGLKIVFSRTLDSVAWNNTKLVKRELVAEVGRMKQESGPGMVILGSGSIVAQLAPVGLIDEYQIALVPMVLGRGRTMFEGIREKLALQLLKSRTFDNGSVFLRYRPV